MNRSYQDSYEAELAQCQLEERQRYEQEAEFEAYLENLYREELKNRQLKKTGEPKCQ